MALFVAICLDAPGALPRRIAAREAHLAGLKALPSGFVKLAGPFLDDAGEMCGSMYVFDAEAKTEVEAFFAADPYREFGVYRSVEIRPWRASIAWT